eukprot:CAMPEP_0117679654 /NCGR_PEP_ID=MMETSP0804-20121206/17928_1 /TAXON_ID=1074897 /ORGANISM="Tetraselmis astigmatica, Strain CCMP880" /LENGTH=1089 /DNA_ID=CAMNT_0005489087 /DNA_START=114 /DNA_END=3381 /DNA_ORIENTATION=-
MEMADSSDSGEGGLPPPQQPGEGNPPPQQEASAPTQDKVGLVLEPAPDVGVDMQAEEVLAEEEEKEEEQQVEEEGDAGEGGETPGAEPAADTEAEEAPAATNPPPPADPAEEDQAAEEATEEVTDGEPEELHGREIIVRGAEPPVAAPATAPEEEESVPAEAQAGSERGESGPGHEEDQYQGGEPYHEEGDRDRGNYEGYFEGEEGQGGYEEGGDDYDDGDSDVFGSDGAMHPDHPLLARAQQALKEQLLEARLKLTEELREKNKALKDAKVDREQIGVDLYGVQQQLAKLQLQLERTHENYNVINSVRMQTEEELDMLRHAHEDQEAETLDEQFRVQQFQDELDKLAATLKQIEAYNEQMKDEIAVTRRQTYVAEESVQKREKVKKEQDYLIDNLQETLKSLHQQLALFTAQLEAQKRETLAAKETLQEAEEEMQNIHFEKKQLVQQWQGTLLSVQKRDEALQSVQDAIYEQQQQELNIDNETEGFRRDIVKEQLKNEQLTAVLRKVEGESEFLLKNLATLREKMERLQDTYAKLQKSSEQTDESMARAEMEGKVLESEKQSVEQATHKLANDIKELENQMLMKLSEQTTAEKSAQKQAQDTMKLRKKVKEEELTLVTLQNELAKLEVDCLNTDAHNEKLQETLKMLDDEIKDKLRIIEQYEVEIRRRNDEIEKRTKEVDLLNRKYEKLTANMEDENTGPLEATINNLQREIMQKGVEGKELQRHWLNFQAELVQLIADNNKMAETVSRLKSEYTIIGQKCQRLDNQYEQQMKEVRNIDSSMGRMHYDLSRLNSHIAKNSELQNVLANDNFNMENNIMAELRELEEEASRLESTIEQEKVNKKDTLAEMLEVERQIMLWERKIQLQREMLDALDPSTGDDVTGAMQKEIHRMELRYSELMRLQEKLVQEMERGISKRSVINIKGKAAQSKKTAEMTEQQLAKACADLKRSIRETEKEAYLSEQRIGELDAVHRELVDRIEESLAETQEVQYREEELKIGLETALSEKHKMLLYTSHQQKMCKRLEDAIAGRYRPVVQDPSRVDAELNAAMERQEAIMQTVEQLSAEAPELSSTLGGSSSTLPPALCRP